MPKFEGLRRHVRFPWRSRASIASDVDEELHFHLDMRVEELIARGLSPADARAEAVRRFGDLEEATAYIRAFDGRTQRGERGRETVYSLGQDLRYAIRQLRRSPAFTMIAVLTLALGIGANTAIFSVVHRLLLDPLPFDDGDRIVELMRSAREAEMLVSPSPRQIDAWRTGARSLEQLATYTSNDFTLAGAPEPEVVRGAAFSPSMTRLLRVRPALGRGFVAQDTSAGAQPVVLLGHGLWRRRFGGDPEILGRVVTINGVAHTVVGVMPRGFGLPFSGRATAQQLWTPHVVKPNDLGAQALGRMHDGVSAEQVSRELTALSASLPKDEHGVEGWGARAVRPQDLLGSGVRDALVVLSGAVGFVLLIACANVANLLLARATSRRRELAVRAALGAGRGRLVRQLLTESLVLALAGGALGLFLGGRTLDLIVALRPATLSGLDEVRLEPMVLALTVIVSVLTGLAFGLVPALLATEQSVGEALKGLTRTASAHAGARRLRSSLVAAEVALSVVLLIGAGLLVRSVVSLQRVEVGFDAANLAAMRIGLPVERYQTEAARSAAYALLLERVRAIPGVSAATVAAGVPPRTGIAFGELEIEGRPLSPAERTTLLGGNMVGPDYFRVLGIPVRAGRSFDRDTSDRAVIINEGMARKFWPGRSAVGARLRMSAEVPWSTVVGVVGDVRVPGQRGSPSQLQYYHAFSAAFEDAQLIVRTTSGVPRLLSQIVRAAATIDPSIRIQDANTVERLLSQSISGPRFNMTLLGAFAALALVLSAVGLYGVIAYSVSQRTREIGVRIALGAREAEVRRLVLGQGVKLAVVGLALGMLAAAGLTRVMRSFLHDVSPLDPPTFFGAGALLGAVALLASYLPARRATRVDPVVALRAE